MQHPVANFLVPRKLARRRYQHGELIDDEKHQRWIGRWRADEILPPGSKPRATDRVLPTGEVIRRIRKWEVLAGKKECPTKRAAQRLLDERLRDVNHIDYRPSYATKFKEFADRWVKTVLIHHKPSSQHSEGSIIRVHLKPAFGDFPMREITAEVLQAWVSSATTGQKTTRNIVDCLRSMWSTAKDWNYVQHDPFQGLRLPKKVAPKTYSFSLEESVAIIEHAREPWKTLFRIVAETGVRSGEVAGLRIEDFDQVNLTLAVRQSVWNKRIQTPKSDAAFRREPISAELAYAIEQVIKTAKPNKYGLIFTGQTGEPLQMIHFANRVMRPLLTELGIRKKLDEMGIKKCGLHAFRRMSATQMDLRGVPLRTRQERLGHSSPMVTLGNYTKPVDQESRNFANEMGALLVPRSIKRSAELQLWDPSKASISTTN
jgi:integrase